MDILNGNAEITQICPCKYKQNVDALTCLSKQGKKECECPHHGSSSVFFPIWDCFFLCLLPKDVFLSKLVHQDEESVESVCYLWNWAADFIALWLHPQGNAPPTSCCGVFEVQALLISGVSTYCISGIYPFGYKHVRNLIYIYIFRF